MNEEIIPINDECVICYDRVLTVVINIIKTLDFIIFDG